MAEDVGAAVVHTGGGHLAIKHPSGWTVYTSASPSDTARTERNTRSQMRRAQRGIRR